MTDEPEEEVTEVREASLPKVADFERGLSAFGHGAGSNLHELAARWAAEDRPRFRRRYSMLTVPGKGKIMEPGDDRLRIVAQNEDEIVAIVNPSNSDFFMHYDKRLDILHFIVNGQAAIVPKFWIKNFAQSFRAIQAKAGHANALPGPRRTKGTLMEHLRYRVHLLRELFKPSEPVAAPYPVETQIADEMERVLQLQGGAVGLLPESAPRSD
jgi:hypothetical protein